MKYSSSLATSENLLHQNGLISNRKSSFPDQSVNDKEYHPRQDVIFTIKYLYIVWGFSENPLPQTSLACNKKNLPSQINPSSTKNY